MAENVGQPLQNTFNAGEFSDRLDGRVDIPRYIAAVKILENWLVLTHGGAMRRPGTHWVAETKDSTTRARLLRFEFNDEQAYILEFGHQYIRFFKDSGQILGDDLITNGQFPEGITGWTDASSGGSVVGWFAGGKRMILVGAAGGTARARQPVTVVADTLHSLSFRVYSDLVPDGILKLRVGTSAGSENLLAEADYAVGVHTVEFTSTGVTTVHLQFTHIDVTNRGLDDVSLQEAPTGAYEIASPYTEDDLDEIKYIQSSDVMYLAHPRWAPRKLTRLGHTDWTLSVINFLPPPVTVIGDTPATTLTPAATTGNGVLFTAGSAFFLAADVDRQIKYQGGRAIIQTVDTPPDATILADIVDPFPDTNPIPSGDWTLDGSPGTGCDPSVAKPVGAQTTLTLDISGWRTTDVGKYVRLHGGLVKIGTFTSSTIVKGEILQALSVDTKADKGTWTLESAAWSDIRGWPRLVSFFEERLCFASTEAQPQTIWGSESGDFEKFAGGVNDANSFAFTISANKSNIGRFLKPSRVLMFGTLGGEFRLTGGTDRPITPSNVDAKSETSYGSSIVDPIRVGAALLFVQRSGRRVRELAFSLDFDSYVAPDLTILSEHLFPRGKTIRDMDYQQESDPVLWTVRSDGVMPTMTYERSNDVVGWSRQITDGSFESVAVIPHTDGDREQVWVIVKRTIGGVEKRYVEFFDDSQGFYGAINVDCGLTYDGAPATVFGGLAHLEGRTVRVVGDGAVQDDQVVVGGEITLPSAVSKVEVGLNYDSTLQTLRLEVPVAGTSQGLLKRWSNVLVRMKDTLGLVVQGERIPFRSTSDPMNAPPSLYSGDKDVLDFSWSTEGFVTIVQDQPLPAHVLAITGRIDVSSS